MPSHTIRSITRLRHVIAIEQHGSFSRAASTLGLTQSALSRSVQTLETELDVVLLERDAKGIRITPAGSVFLRQAKALIAATDNLEATMRRLAPSQGAQVSFGIAPMPASVVLTELFLEYAQKPGSERLRAHTETGMLLRSLLENSVIDFLVCAEGAITLRPNLKTSLLGYLPITIRVRPGHPLLGCHSVTAEDLSRYPMIGSGLPAALSDEIMPNSVIYDPALTCEDYGVLANVCSASDAYCLFAKQRSTPELVDLETSADLIPSSIPMLLVEDRERPLTVSTRAVADRIQSLLFASSDAHDTTKTDM